MRYFVETRQKPPNSDFLNITEHSDLDDALECAKSLTCFAKIWAENEAGDSRSLVWRTPRPAA